MIKTIPASRTVRRLAALVALLALVASTLPFSAAATIVPGTPSANATPTPPPVVSPGTSEIAPELPPPDLPTINQQGYNFSFKSTLNADLDAVPKESPVYTLQRETPTKDDAVKLNESLGVKGELKEQGTNVWVANGNGSLFVSSDFIQYTSSQQPAKGDLPTDDQAVAFAKEFLRLSGLLPPNIGDGRVVQRTPDAGRLTVQFGPDEPATLLAAFPSVTVTMGPGGTILEASKRWATVTRSDVYRLRSSQDAWQQVLSNQGYIEADILAAGLPAGSDVKGAATYNNVSIAYTTAGPPGGQQYLEPVFVFRGRVRLEGSDTTYAIRTYVPALANSGAPVG